MHCALLPTIDDPKQVRNRIELTTIREDRRGDEDVPNASRNGRSSDAARAESSD
jgi:hypothetical protein